MDRRLIALAIAFGLMKAGPAMALDVRSFDCAANAFIDDSRYPPSDEYLALNRAMAIVIIDAGDRLVLETTLAGTEISSSQLPVTERLPDRLVAADRGEQSEHSVTILIPPGAGQVTGTLIYRTYEIDHKWLFDCKR